MASTPTGQAVTKALYVTAAEADLIMDAYRVSLPQTRALVLKAASLVLEFASDAGVAAAGAIVAAPPPPSAPDVLQKALADARAAQAALSALMPPPALDPGPKPGQSTGDDARPTDKQ